MKLLVDIKFMALITLYIYIYEHENVSFNVLIKTTLSLKKIIFPFHLDNFDTSKYLNGIFIISQFIMAAQLNGIFIISQFSMAA